MNEAVNPYSAPSAEVADVYEQGAVASEPPKLFSSEGRIGRARFLAYSMYAYLIYIPVSMALAIVGPLFGGKGAMVVIALLVLSLIPYTVFYVMTAIKRSHDMGWSGWWVFAMLIPLVALVWIFAAGSYGPNRFGPPPPPNPLSVKIGAWLIVVFMVLGILGAVAAIPAYEAYVQKAKAGQVQRP